MLSLLASSPAYVPSMTVAPTTTRAAVSMDMTKEALATKLNPAIGYFDPLGLASADFWSQGNAATWGFLRQAEIKHGRVAMFAFCGYVAQANGLRFPDLIGMPTSGATPEEQWFNLPVQGRIQILLFIGFLEFWGEFGGQHYMKGGRPGEYPPFKDIPFHKAHMEKFSLYDPLGIAAKDSDEKKAAGLIKEINNGRLAQIGMIAMVSESHLPGSVPGLTGLIKPFAGDVMAPLA